jgi:cytochrome c peroxidase
MKAPRREGAPVDGSRAALVDRGHRLFDDARQGCASCHLGGGTDRARHDVGSGREIERSLAFDTPSLTFVAGTAPYFHDGRHATLMDVLDAHDQKMGTTVHLGAADKLALAAYLETL